jgi:hypothetical protein
MRKVLLAWLLRTSCRLLCLARRRANTLVNSSFPNTTYGSSVIDVVGPGASTYLKLNLAAIPPGGLAG